MSEVERCALQSGHDGAGRALRLVDLADLSVCVIVGQKTPFVDAGRNRLIITVDRRIENALLK